MLGRTPRSEVLFPLTSAYAGSVATTELEIRRAAYTDDEARALTEQAQAYYGALYGGPDSSPITSAEFTTPNGDFVLGYVADRAVAMGGWRLHIPIDGFAARRPAEIRRMYVTAEARGRGFARSLLWHLEWSARQAGADALVLETGRPQVEAVALYRAAGYHDIPSFGHYAEVDGAVHLGKLLVA